MIDQPQPTTQHVLAMPTDHAKPDLRPDLMSTHIRLLVKHFESLRIDLNGFGKVKKKMFFYLTN